MVEHHQQQQQTKGNDANEATIDSADIVRLMLVYLTSVGLHASARTLRQESGIGIQSNALIVPTLPSHIQQGEWGSVMKVLQLYQSTPHPQIEEQVILELADEESISGLALAQNVLAVSRDDLDCALAPSTEEDGGGGGGNTINRTNATTMTMARSLEQRLAALAANPQKYYNVVDLDGGAGATAAASHSFRSHQHRRGDDTPSTQSAVVRRELLFPNESKQERRNRIAKELMNQTVPIPINRLPTLLHQSIKWQTWTGQLPTLKTKTKESFQEFDQHGRPIMTTTTTTKKKKRKRHFDLVLGVAATSNAGRVVGDEMSTMYDNDDDDDDDEYASPIPSELWQKVKFGKSVVCEAACFVRNGLVTASSDGLIEIWDSHSYQLNTDTYKFQAQDQVMGHGDDTAVLALAVSHDQTLLASGDACGIVKIWKLASGTCLRQYQAQSSSISALDWSADGSRLLVASSEGVCREFGIVSQHVLQEYIGHNSYIHSCSYLPPGNSNSNSNSNSSASSGIVTGSADGTVRLWKYGQCQAIWQPQQSSRQAISPGDSLVVDATSLLTDAPSIIAVLSVPGRSSQWLVVPRSSTAYLVDIDGTVQKKYTISVTGDNNNDDEEDVICAATVTADWVYLCTLTKKNTSDCHVFSIRSGKLETTIVDFGVISTTKTTSQNHIAEISLLVPHPQKAILVGCSNDKTQKKGILAVWK